MNNHKNLEDRYIQLVETFITAIDSGRSGAELEGIRNEIRMLSEKLHQEPTVENHTRTDDFLSPIKPSESDTGLVL